MGSAILVDREIKLDLSGCETIKSMLASGDIGIKTIMSLTEEEITCAFSKAKFTDDIQYLLSLLVGESGRWGIFYTHLQYAHTLPDGIREDAREKLSALISAARKAAEERGKNISD